MSGEFSALRMIASDLDRTLLGEGGELSDAAAGVLGRCRARGLITAFATARPERATWVFQQKFRPDYVFANNGASIYHNGEKIYEAAIPRDVLRAVLRQVLAHPKVACIVIEAEGRQYTNCADTSDWGLHWNPAYTDFSSIPDVDAPKFSIECADGEAIRRMLEHYPELTLSANSGEDRYQIVCAGESKLHAIERVAAMLGFSVKQVAAFGDDHNDVAMLKRCGVGVAVKEAIPEAKRAARFICPSHREDGVARWIEDHILSMP